jgi:hypothetical protein
MVEALVVLTSDAGRGLGIRERISAHARVVQAFGSRVLIVEIAPPAISRLATSPTVLGVFTDEVPDTIDLASDMTGALAVAGWNERRRGRLSATPRVGEGRPWDDPAFEPEGHPDASDPGAPDDEARDRST